MTANIYPAGGSPLKRTRACEARALDTLDHVDPARLAHALGGSGDHDSGRAACPFRDDCPGVGFHLDVDGALALTCGTPKPCDPGRLAAEITARLAQPSEGGEQ